MRTETGRRYRDLVASYRQGLGLLNEERMSLLRTAAGITVKLETMQAAIVNGDPVDTRLLIRLANSQARALRALGEAKEKAQAAGERPGDALRRHLAEMVAKRDAKEAEARAREASAEEPPER
jgi:hypothetical protein